MKHYLKYVSNYGAESFRFYDSETGASIGVDKWQIEFETVDKDEVEWHISHDLSNGYKFITPVEFMDYYTERLEKLRELSECV